MQSPLVGKLPSILGVRLLYVDTHHLVYLTATAHSPVAVLFSEPFTVMGNKCLWPFYLLEEKNHV